MSETDFKKLYNDLNKLLNEICDFLKDEIKEGKLSLKTQELASSLIDRTNIQLAAIAEVQKDTIDEKLLVKAIEDDSGIAIYKNTINCPYEDLPASKLSPGEKKGALQRRLLKPCMFKKYKRIYGGINDNWLLLYRNEKDAKPFECIQLSSLDVQKCPEDSPWTKDSKKQETTFELLSNNNLLYQFATLTSKDREQWITTITRKKTKQTDNETFMQQPPPPSKTVSRKRSLPTIPPPEPEEEEEPTYEAIESYVAMDNPRFGSQKTTLKPKMVLPPHPTPPRNPPPSRSPSIPDEEDYYDDPFKLPDPSNAPPPITATQTRDSGPVAEEEEEELYDEIPAEEKPKPEPEPKEEDDEDMVYDVPDLKETSPPSKGVAKLPQLNSNLVTSLQKALKNRAEEGHAKKVSINPNAKPKPPILVQKPTLKPVPIAKITKKPDRTSEQSNASVKQLRNKFNMKT